ncbi:SIR2 family NAD-dependent protein deacylase [Pseudomonas tolaasii]|uniref:SIR2 family NAD-dependent protein deacylase n=1 Tax=Pseudomonas tolaasii TaxID=29442 RepID=UPI001C532867|nr:NAD-dependent deacylase [Pseudomonas tolaasii]MBW4792961.1 NAD-dependent deacylase [Pseudomonas tolaasii]QXQ21484.1 NAD-dependent deacylase [Pseudomonas tolaasii]
MDDMSRATQALRAARKVVFFTGAGISAESGIPTFRDKLTGLWAKHDPQRLETAAAFRENPSLVWGWYIWRRNQAKQAKPNAAHHMVTHLADSGRSVFVVTQNIDDLHERAGSRNVLHLHGSLATPICFACKRPADLTNEQAAISDEFELIQPPRCRRCNGRLRPGVVWFGEDLPYGAWKTAMAEVKSCNVLISVGTSGVVRPAADIPEIAMAAGATVIHVNLSDVTLGNPNELMLVGPAAKVLPLLLLAVNDPSPANDPAI